MFNLVLGGCVAFALVIIGLLVLIEIGSSGVESTPATMRDLSPAVTLSPSELDERLETYIARGRDTSLSDYSRAHAWLIVSDAEQARGNRSAAADALESLFVVGVPSDMEENRIRVVQLSELVAADRTDEYIAKATTLLNVGSIDPADELMVRWGMIKSHTQRGDLDAAGEAAAEAVAMIKPGDELAAQIYNEQAYIAVHTDDYDLGRQATDNALAAAASDSEFAAVAQLLRGEIEAHDGNTAGATGYFKAAADNPNANPATRERSLFMHGAILYDVGQFDAARADFDAVKAMPGVSAETIAKVDLLIKQLEMLESSDDETAADDTATDSTLVDETAAADASSESI